ncbi:intercompartmental signaling factor BofC [Cytobacillus purgationiresistens]|uniref:Forespore regulator of the sigma-K checkpoint n=1 Tax=Cytobacillus purgationiresistens TaxID=863449 RepID=A0ABU0AII4_9BACI|nr:intercompartmental signaling factor BofC [Cytobacillus purgationiresistens]MDQ0269885.1 forespore regulator of the sigma-K checkpoint [Cytobacillus purgationiresistens]
MTTKRALFLTLALLVMSPFVHDWAGFHASAEEIARSIDERSSSLNMNVILERVYLDGEVSEEAVVETISSYEDFWSKYSGWNLMNMNKGEIVFRRQIDDISPLLKANGYFGITDEGVLTIYNGKPQKANIIQSFFQIDLGKLESTKCEKLKQGIPIMTKDRYMEVLEIFKPYSFIEHAS